MRAAHRRPVYIASLEAHVDRLHAQLIERGLYPVAFAELAPFKGMSSKVVKSTVAGLQTDAHFIRSKQTEIERTVGRFSAPVRCSSWPDHAAAEEPGLAQCPEHRRPALRRRRPGTSAGEMCSARS
jgi:hypothetical protein